MHSLWPVLSLSALLLGPAPEKPADLAKLDRTLKKEPTYKGKPAYCLLVFGREAKTWVWLVVDGDTLLGSAPSSGTPGQRGKNEMPWRIVARHIGRAASGSGRPASGSGTTSMVRATGRSAT